MRRISVIVIMAVLAFTLVGCDRGSQSEEGTPPEFEMPEDGPLVLLAYEESEFNTAVAEASVRPLAEAGYITDNRPVSAVTPDELVDYDGVIILAGGGPNGMQAGTQAVYDAARKRHLLVVFTGEAGGMDDVETLTVDSDMTQVDAAAEQIADKASEVMPAPAE